MLISRLTCLVLLTAGLTANACFAKNEPETDDLEKNLRNKLIVHEWGTFTELQNFHGHSIGGINTDDEPVPTFVHAAGSQLLEPTVEPWRRKTAWFGKAMRRLDAVTTRLETPVVYFYPPANQMKPLLVDVDVQLRGGWLSEFFPRANANSPGIRQRDLNPNAVGSLQWKNLEVGALGKNAADQVPETDEHVWLAPRKTQAALVRATNTKTGEAEVEKYLFYRGVGNFSGPLQLQTDLENDQIHITSKLYAIGAGHPIRVANAWLVSVRDDGEVAFRAFGPFTVPHDRVAQVDSIERSFLSTDYSAGHLEQLQQAMHSALVTDGLFEDEATAMLSTWRDAYFKSAGLRMFYVVPREWTDDRMPLTLSVDAEIQRVMMGRVELISDDQIELLGELKSRPVASVDWKNSIPESDARDRFFAGQNNLDELSALGVQIPDCFRCYVRLGRFRNALLRHEAMKNGDPAVLEFLRSHQLMTQSLNKRFPKSPQTKPSEDVVAAQ